MDNGLLAGILSQISKKTFVVRTCHPIHQEGKETSRVSGVTVRLHNNEVTEHHISNTFVRVLQSSNRLSLPFVLCVGTCGSLKQFNYRTFCNYKPQNGEKRYARP